MKKFAAQWLGKFVSRRKQMYFSRFRQLLAVGFGDLASSLAEEIGTPLEEFAPSDYLRDLITKDVSDAPSSSAPAAKIRRLELNQPSKSGNSVGLHSFMNYSLTF
jgi:hypothetical protein